MQGNRGKDTGPELALRSELHALGLRFRLSSPLLMGVRARPDVVFGGARVAVFMDGCFWHGCPEHFYVPATNPEFWASKIEANRKRDRRTDEVLAAAGWRVIRVWEHERAGLAANRIARAVRS
jgi:DNA mismatch endonuclease, patch repair protein